jgi:hypothetical protein
MAVIHELQIQLQQLAAYLRSCSLNDACVTFLLINTICSIDVQVFTDPVIVLSLFMLCVLFE